MISIDQCVVRFLDVLYEMRLVPVFNELIVFDPFSSYGTAIDLIAYNVVIGEFVAIEIKTVSSCHFDQSDHSFTPQGYENEPYEQLPTDMMLNGIWSPLRIADCPYNRHQIQLITGFFSFSNLRLFTFPPGMFIAELCYDIKIRTGHIFRFCSKARESLCYGLTINVSQVQNILLAFLPSLYSTTKSSKT